jgi:hypothetical protein
MKVFFPAGVNRLRRLAALVSLCRFQVPAFQVVVNQHQRIPVVLLGISRDEFCAGRHIEAGLGAQIPNKRFFVL